MKMERMEEILYEQEHERQRRQWLSHEARETEYFLLLKTRWLGGRGRVRALKASQEGWMPDL